MAIKNKSRGRSKPKQVARAPKRAPVEVPTPFLSRRWVQAVAAFVVGVFAMVVFIWVTNGLRDNDANALAAGEAASRRTASTSYQTMVQGAFGGIGTATPGVPPLVFPEMTQTLQDMGSGPVPEGAGAVFERAGSQARATGKAIAKYNVSSTIRDQGFDQTEAAAFTSSAQQMILSLQLFEQCADVAKVATEASSAEADNLVGVATKLCDGAQAQLSQGWVDYLTALRAGGVVETPQDGLVPELPGGGG